jgi:hypothetical protein
MLNRPRVALKGVVSMTDAVWFFHHSGTRHGPVSETELRAIVARGDLLPEDLVWQPEMDDWRPASTVPELFSGSGSSVKGDNTTPPVWRTRSTASTRPETMSLLIPAQSAIRVFEGFLTPGALSRVETMTAMIGQFIYVAGAGLSCVLLIVVAFGHRQYGLLIAAVAALPIALLIALSSAWTFGHVREGIGRAAIRVRSRAVFEGFAAAAMGSGLFAVLVGFSLTVVGAGAWPILTGAGILLVSLQAAAGLLCPSVVNATVDPEVPEVRSVAAYLSFMVRLLLVHLAPAVFALAALVVLIAVAQGLMSSLDGSPVSDIVAIGWLGRSLLVGFLPLGSWILFAVLSTVLEVAGSLLTPVDGSNR